MSLRYIKPYAMSCLYLSLRLLDSRHRTNGKAGKTSTMTQTPTSIVTFTLAFTRPKKLVRHVRALVRDDLTSFAEKCAESDTLEQIPGVIFVLKHP
jgi:hypothetical protein